MAYSPLGRGFLTGRFQSSEDFEDGDFRTANPRFSGDNLERNNELVRHVHELADDKGVKPGQVALAWVLSKGVVPIPGTKRRTYLEENVAASDVELSDDEVARLEQVFEPGGTAGERYAEAGMKGVGI